MKPHPGLAVVTCLLLAAPAVAASDRPARPNEIIVSSANYALTPPKELARMFRRPADLTEPPTPVAGPPPQKYYQFLRGEIFESDLPYLAVCQLLAPALTKKNLHNTFDQAKVDLVLRVSFGGRRWRDPLVRVADLEWRQGLVPRRRDTAALGADSAWDARAGGDEAALRQTERMLTELDPANGVEGMADRLIGGLPTEDYFLVVVDAFEVAELRAKGNDATRAWTTFIAVPRQGGQNFSQVVAGMIEKAAPYFGETLPGKVRFTDREGTVKIGEATVVEEPQPGKK